MAEIRRRVQESVPTPSYSLEDERGLVGSLLMAPDQTPNVLKLIGTLDFGDPALRACFESIREHWRAADGEGQDLAALALDDLRDHPAVDNPHLLLADIAENVVTGAHVATYAKSVRDAALKRRLYSAAQTAAEHACNGHTGEQVLADLAADLGALQRSYERRGGVRRYSLRKLVDSHPELRLPVVDGLFREGETVNVIASSKVGKSWLTYGLALAVANNEPWLGRFDVSPGKVLLIDNELHESTLSTRIRSVTDAMGIPIESVDRDLEIWSLRGDLRSLEQLASEFERIEPGEFKLIILDAFYRFAQEGVSENDNAAMTRVYNLLDKLAAQTEAAIVVVHHASKGDQSRKDVTDVGAGAGAQSRAADCHLVIRPHEEDGCAVLEAAVRSFAPVQPVVLRWSYPVWIADTQLDPSKTAGRNGAMSKRAKEDRALKEQIVKAVRQAREPLTRRKIREAVQIGDTRANRLVDELVSDLRIAVSRCTVKGNDCVAFSVPLSNGADHVVQTTSDQVDHVASTGVVRPPKGDGTTPPVAPEAEPEQSERSPDDAGMSADAPLPSLETAVFGDGAA